MASQVGYYFKCSASLNGIPAPYFVGDAPSGTPTNPQFAYRMLSFRDSTWLGYGLRCYLTTDVYTAQSGSSQQKITDYASILLANGNGYTGGRTVSLPTITASQARVTYPMITYTASGGSIGPVRGMFLVGLMDTSAPREQQDFSAIYWWIDFGQSVTTVAGDTLSIQPRLHIVS